jgi:hypothetical protein
MKTELIARVAVDSGMLRIGDPCYEMPFEHEVGSKGELKHLGQVFDIPVSKAYDFATQLGDGIYDVYGIYQNDKLVSVMIDLEENL